MQYVLELPEIVEEAHRRAVDLGFDLRAEGNRAGSAAGPSCCLDEVGALLRVLVASRPGGRIGEIGSGAGVGTAWMADGLNSNARLTTVELEPRLAEAVRDGFARRADVDVLTGDWQDAFAERAPFDLLFADGGGVGSRQAAGRAAAQLVKPSGLVILDDLTPEALWPDAWRGTPDPKRELAFRSGLFDSAEVLVRPDVAVLLMTRRENAT